MKKTMSRKTYRLLIICLAVCLMACGALGTYAYFVSQKSGSGNYSFGKIEFKLGDGSSDINQQLPVNSNVSMGAPILSSSVVATADSNSSGMYIRFKVEFTSADSGMADIVDQLNSLFNIADNFKAACSATKDTDGWVYYTDNTPKPLSIEAGKSVTILDKNLFCIPTGLTGTPTSSTVSVTITVQSIQSRNIEQSLAEVKNAFEYDPKTESN